MLWPAPMGQVESGSGEGANREHGLFWPAPSGQADNGSCICVINGASGSTAAFNNAGGNKNITSAASAFWPPHLEVDNTLSFNSDSNAIPFWPAPSGQAEKGKIVANFNLSAPPSPHLGSCSACTDIEGCANVQPDDVSNSAAPDDNHQELGINKQSQ